jgi:spore coat polysaccharide biosynthesis protein SpsF
MKRVVAIVQARMGSSRLSGKSLRSLAGRPIIEHVLRRVARARTVHEVVLATTGQPQDNLLCREAVHLGIAVFRGSEDDVLDRYVKTALAFHADVVVRICADNPLVAPEEIDRIVRHHEQTKADYSFNHIPALDNHYPDGLGAEVISYAILPEISHRSLTRFHREHVTSYIWDHLPDFRVETIAAPPNIAGPEIKLDVDTPADLERLERLFQYAPAVPENWTAEEIVRAYRAQIIEGKN